MKNKIYISAFFSLLVFSFIFVNSAFAKRSITLKTAKRIYTDSCSVCHAENGNGRTHSANALKPKPRNFLSPEAKADLTEFKMIQVVTEGSVGTAMVPWKLDLSPAEIIAVVTYIRSEFMKVTTYPKQGFNDDTEGLALIKTHAHGPEEGSGEHAGHDMHKESKKWDHKASADYDLKEGRRVYLSNCKPCHGENGDGKGPRYAFIKPSPRRFTDEYEMTGIDKVRIKKSVTEGRQGSQMMAWGGILTPHQIDSVVEYIWQNFVSKKK